MTIKLPGFADSYCQSLTACGFMDLPPREVLASLLGGEQRTHAVIRYKTSRGDGFARAVLGLSKTQGTKKEEQRLHVHLDVVLKSYFSIAPSPTHKRADFDRLLRKLIDRELTLHPSSEWTIPSSDLDTGRAYPWNADIKTEVGGVGMELIGAEFRVTGGKITYLHWRWDDRKKKQQLILTTYWEPHKTTITPGYLADELASEESYLRSSILGEPRQPSERDRP